jgi:hypothetical protein
VNIGLRCQYSGSVDDASSPCSCCSASRIPGVRPLRCASTSRLMDRMPRSVLLDPGRVCHFPLVRTIIGYPYRFHLIALCCRRVVLHKLSLETTQYLDVGRSFYFLYSDVSVWYSVGCWGWTVQDCREPARLGTLERERLGTGSPVWDFNPVQATRKETRQDDRGDAPPKGARLHTAKKTVRETA